MQSQTAASDTSLKPGGISPVVTTEEAVRFQDLGLGRGVDATDSSMWDNKSPIVLKEISTDLANIIGTEEGGEKQYYSEEISSRTSLEMKMHLSIDEPNSQVKIGIDAHHSRTNSSTRTIMGIKIRTRTIAFRTDLFRDLPLRNFNIDNGTEASVLPCEMEYTDQASSEEVHSKSETRVSSFQNVPNTFERQLCAWILNRIIARKQQSGDQVELSKIAKLTGNNPAAKLATYIQSLELDSAEMQHIAKDCEVFVGELGITHYISSIELGALQYRVYTKRELEREFGSGTKIGFKQLAKVQASFEHEKKRSRETTQRQEIGRIVDGKVQRKSSDEAVIGFHIQPIHRLVQLSYLQTALQAAVKQYIFSRANRTGKTLVKLCRCIIL